MAQKVANMAPKSLHVGPKIQPKPGLQVNGKRRFYFRLPVDPFGYAVLCNAVGRPGGWAGGRTGGRQNPAKTMPKSMRAGGRTGGRAAKSRQNLVKFDAGGGTGGREGGRQNPAQILSKSNKIHPKIDPKSSQNRPKIDQNGSQNRPKIVPESILEPTSLPRPFLDRC